MPARLSDRLEMVVSERVPRRTNFRINPESRDGGTERADYADDTLAQDYESQRAISLAYQLSRRSDVSWDVGADQGYRYFQTEGQICRKRKKSRRRRRRL
jgi:hypothetical protein